MSKATRLSDLTIGQLRMMIRLDDGQEHEDSVGLEVGSLNVDELRDCVELVQLGLVQTSPGWGGLFWLRLTEAGRRVREKGWEA